MMFPGAFVPESYIGGRIQRVDPHDGTVTDLYTECDGHPLRAPNDLVMDGHGGFWFTDHGIRDHATRTSDLTGDLLRQGRRLARSARWCSRSKARTASACRPTSTRSTGPRPTPAGVQRRSIVGPGEARTGVPLDLSGVLCGLPGMQYLDSLAVDGEGWVCVATLFNGGITAISPDGTQIEHHATGDLMTTNICFGGDDLRTAYVTCRARVASCRSPGPAPASASLTSERPLDGSRSDR